MATFNGFDQFPEDLGLGVHNLSAHTLKAYLSNVAPNAGTHAVKANLAEISAGNGYTAGGEDVQNTYSQSAGVATLGATNITWTATGGTIGPFQHVAVYNDTPTTPADPLIGWWTHTAEVTLQIGESFTVAFQGGAIMTVAFI